ncbi:MAG: pyridoxal-phosphate dependent enzyme [Kofleriaceae bacterium]
MTNALSVSTADSGSTLAPFSAERLSTVRALISPWIRRTPLESSPALSERTGISVLLKLECWQVTGSFKPRIAFAKLLALPPEVRQRGVVASTAGGHGIGLSYASARLDVPCYLCVPESIDPEKLKRISATGASVSMHSSVAAAAKEATALAAERGWTRVPAYDDADVIAGDASVGLEIIEDAPAVDAFVVGMGGGGLASGLGVAARSRGRMTHVYGVQPTPVAVLNRWLRAGRATPELTRAEAKGISIADGLGAPVLPEAMTFSILRELDVQPLNVEDAELVAAMKLLLDDHQLLVEPSGAAAVAGLVRHADVLRTRGVRTAALVLTGRNISAERRRALGI